MVAYHNKQMSASRGQRPDGHSFAQIPSAEIPRSVFNRSCGVKTTFDSGFLVPIFVDEALPGDTMSLSVATFARMATLLHPVMDNQYLDLFFFAVPNRIIWDNWEKFNGEQEDPGDSTDFLIPTVSTSSPGFGANSIYDYMGIPPDAHPLTISSLWLRAYNLIWNEWFRDENLQDSVLVPKGNGPDSVSSFVLLRRGKRHDYFTSSLPFPQKGASVLLPLGTTAPVVAAGDTIPSFDTVTDATARNILTTNAADPLRTSPNPVGASPFRWVDPKLEADLTSATAATINQIREAFQIQRLFERDARGGTRYTEIIRSHFGVVSPDARLQRPEYLGGGSAPIMINPVADTAALAPKKVGQLAAYGTIASQSRGFMKSFTEHCVIIGLACIRADLNYQQGINRMWSRSTRFDFYWPAFSHLGEQAVLSKEIFADGTASDDDVFGYQERYAEYRYKPSMITGEMRSSFPQSLDTWHLAQDFAVRPLLNDTFIEENPPVDRIIAVVTEPHWLFDAWFQYRCVRPMPTYSVPGMVDHF